MPTHLNLIIAPFAVVITINLLVVGREGVLRLLATDHAQHLRKEPPQIHMRPHPPTQISPMTGIGLPVQAPEPETQIWLGVR